MSNHDGGCTGIKELFESRLRDAYNVLNIKYKASSDNNEIDALVILLSKNQTIDQISFPKKLFDNDKLSAIKNFLNQSKFTFEKNSFIKLPFLVDSKYITLFFYGLGESSEIVAPDLESMGKKIYNNLFDSHVSKAEVFYDSHNLDYEIISRLSLGMALNKFRFNLKTKIKEDEGENNTKSLDLIEFIVSLNDVKNLENYYNNTLKPLVTAVNLTKAYCDASANIIYPESLANYIKEDFKSAKLGIEVQILEEKEMADLGMGALLGVAQAADFKPRFVVMKWNGGAKNAQPLLFVGKGVTFDSGGLSLKPADSMEGMKYDMSGAATVAGLIRVLAERKAKVNAIGIIGLVENAVSGNAQRPGDIVKSMSGKTIEVLNTDAEGRLVLADAFTYGQTKITPKPQIMIDLATLTGAAIVALGTNTHAAILSNDDKLAGKLLEIGKFTNEKLWRLPLGEAYAKKMNSGLADIQNISNSKGFGGGTITAAEFLKEFVDDDVRWAHLDIANVDSYSSNSGCELRGSVAFGIKLLNEFVNDFEKQIM